MLTSGQQSALSLSRAQSSIPGWGTMIPQAMQPKNKNKLKQKKCSSITKDFNKRKNKTKVLEEYIE